MTSSAHALPRSLPCSEPSAPVPTQRPARRPAQRVVVAALALGALLAGAPRASALTDEEVYRTMRFNTPPPGARALGMGGAFIAVADDPTAAYTNPAGLGFLDRPQLMLEERGTQYKDSTRYELGEVPGLSPSLASATIHLDEMGVESPAFVSYVHPLNDHWVIGVSRHEWINSSRKTLASYSSTAFPTFESSAPGIEREALTSEGRSDILMDVYAVSVALTPIEQISIGLTVGAARMDVTSNMNNTTYSVLDANGNGLPDTLLRPIDYRTVIDDSNVQPQWTAGIIWRPIDTISFGLTYHEGPRYKLTEQVTADGTRAKDLRQYLFTAGIANADGKFINTFKVPDSYGLGVAFGPYLRSRHDQGGLTIAADAVHVEYADMLDGFVAGLNSQLFGSAAIGTTFAIDDQTEFHFGMAYSWTVGYNNSIHLRGGAYSDPDHSLKSNGKGGGVGVFRGRKDIVHGTLGAGFTLKRGYYSFELDAVADMSELGGQYSGSALFKF